MALCDADLLGFAGCVRNGLGQCGEFEDFVSLDLVLVLVRVPGTLY